MRISTGLLAITAAAYCAWAGAQTPTAPGPTVAPAPAVAEAALAPAQPGDCCRVAAGTPVELEIVDPLSSGRHQRGDRFVIRLHAALRHGDVVVVPAGTTGIGEIVHADRSRGGGKPGELLLAARYLEFNGTQIPLRGLKFGGQGQDKTKTALGVAIAAGPFAHFIRGREIEIPAYTLVSAKLAQELALPAAPPAATVSAAPQPSALPTIQE